MSIQSTEISFTVKDNESGQRLDVYLAQTDHDLSRSQVKRLIEEGDVLVNGKSPKVGQVLKADDVIILKQKPPIESTALPQEIHLDIIYEDEAIIVINKPAGMVVHPAPGNPDKTLVNALLFHCHDLSGIGGVMRPGIVHRLDKGTTGLLVAAKTDAAHRCLTDQFVRHDVHKTYEAIVWGDVKGNQGEILMPVGRHPGDRKKMSTRSKRGRDAHTLWNVRERFAIATLLDVEIKTGRTHQIRVHLSDRGYPVIGDTVYGNSSQIRAIKDPVLKVEIKAMDRQALHSAKLSFLHPSSGKRVEFSVAMPEDMAGLCVALRKSGK